MRWNDQWVTHFQFFENSGVYGFIKRRTFQKTDFQIIETEHFNFFTKFKIMNRLPCRFHITSTVEDGRSCLDVDIEGCVTDIVIALITAADADLKVNLLMRTLAKYFSDPNAPKPPTPTKINVLRDDYD